MQRYMRLGSGSSACEDKKKDRGEDKKDDRSRSRHCRSKVPLRTPPRSPRKL
jgi:hypothetical protein